MNTDIETAIKEVEKMASEMPEMRKKTEIDLGKFEVDDFVDMQNVHATAYKNNDIEKEVTEWLFDLLGGDDPSPEKWEKQPFAEKLTAIILLLKLDAFNSIRKLILTGLEW